MTAAIFGLVGVVTGALLQGTWAWVMERRRESWAAKRAARLFVPRLTNLSRLLDYVQRNDVMWGTIAAAIEANLDEWPKHSEVFAGTLSYEQWLNIEEAARAMSQVTWRAGEEGHETLVTDEDRKELALLHDVISPGVVTCILVGVRGVSRQPVRSALRNIRENLRPRSDEDIVREAYGEEEAREYVETQRRIDERDAGSSEPR